MSIIYQNGKFINTIENKLRQLENKVNNGGSSGGGTSITLVEHGTSNTDTTISPNTLHKWDEIAELTLTLGAETPGIVNEYLIQFTSGSTPTVLTLPEDIKWASKLEIKANKIYQISIVNNLAAFIEFNASNIPSIEITLTSEDITKNGTEMIITNPDILKQFQELREWIISAEHTGSDIDAIIEELGGELPAYEVIRGVTSDSAIVTINIPEEGLEVAFTWGVRALDVDPAMGVDAYSFMYLDLTQGFMVGLMLDMDSDLVVLYVGG